jgi:hypothetical protein
MTKNKILSLFLLLILFQSSAVAQYCANGNVNTATCGCSCPSSKFVYNGWDCICDVNQIQTPQMIWSYKTLTEADGCAGSCPYGTYSYDWWCGVTYGAVWSVADCGCKCVSPKSKVSGQCKCPYVDCASQNKILNESTCACECDSSTQATCQTAYKQYDSSTCSCGGCIAPHVLQGSSCGCPAYPLNSTQDPSTCTWTCNTGYQNNSGVCVSGGGGEIQ